VDRRQFLAGVAGLGAVGALAVAGVDREDPLLVYKVEQRLGLAPGGPDVHLPPSGWPLYSGSFVSRYMKTEVGWAFSAPTGLAPRAIVVGLYGKGGDQYSVFGGVRLPDAAAYVKAPLAIASANGGPDSYWHRRADGTDAHAMVVHEFVPLLARRFGPLPVALYGYSMGGFGALLAAEKAVQTGAPDLFKAVAAASPALWEAYGQTAPGAFDDAANFAANNVFADVPALRGLAVRLDCGTFDPFYGATRHLSSLMDWPHSAVFKPSAAHTGGFWRWAAPAQMAFLARACEA
jgi:hypothetical protein